MIIDREKNKLFSIVGSWEVAIKRSSPVLHKMIYNVHVHFLRGLRDFETRNILITFVALESPELAAFDAHREKYHIILLYQTLSTWYGILLYLF